MKPRIVRCWTLALCLCCGVLTTTSNAAAADAGANRLPAIHSIPVILDTDIGDDIDDTWALGLLLSSPEYDVKLVVGDHGKNLYRARLLAKFLKQVGRTDIPVGIGLDVDATGTGPLAAWVKDFNLNTYPGRIYPDGVQAIVDTIMTSPKQVIVIGIGPVPNLAAALAREPRLVDHARFVGMDGSVRRGYGGSPQPAAEYNVKADVKAAQRVLGAAWDVTITPLDTCGIVQLTGARFARVRDSHSPIARVVMTCYRIWSAAHGQAARQQAELHSSTLFDPVAVYLGLSQSDVKMESLGLRVTNDGFTRVDPSAKVIHVATEWKDLDAFKDFLVNRLTQTPVSP